MKDNEEVLVALSGGMDSAAVVLFLREAGYRPRALFLDLLGSPDATRQAAETADRIGVELLVEPCADRFRQEVVEYVLAEHAAGRTPSPCVRCNARIKWRLLTEAADRLGIFHIATGHYVRRIRHEGHDYVRRGADPVKDQSYYLWELPEAWIERAILPLGDYTKAEVRRILEERYGLREVATKRESMGICFLEGRRYADFLRSGLPSGLVRPGEAVDRTGRTVGSHEGFPLYTAGQKRGLTLTDPALAVVGVEAARNRVVVGPYEALFGRKMILEGWRAVCREELFGSPEQLQIAVRGIGRNPKKGCRLRILADGRLQVSLLHDAAWAPMPGQPVVFYRYDRVVGGGILNNWQ